MKRFCAALVAILLGANAPVALASSASASSTTRCTRVKAGPDGYVRCYEVSRIVHHTVRVEAVPVRNASQVTVHASCRFSRTITKVIEGAGGFTSQGRLTIAEVIEIGSSWNATLRISQSATAATEVAGDFWLKPGQRVTCLRTYGFVTAKARSYDRWDVGSQIRNVTASNVTVPSSLGADFAS